MTQRIFITLPISDSFKRKIEGWKKEFWVKNPDVSNKIRWIPPENLHITLIPPFYKDEEEIKEVLEAISSIEGKIGGFELNFEKISYGPTSFKPRLVWISGKSHKSAEGLKSLLEERLKLPHNNRPFSPHITIGRFKEKNFRFFRPRRLDAPFRYTEKFEEFLLMESKTLPKGAVYKILGKLKI